ncbi:MAG TPA: FAD:protein FMN transferase, partial [Nocardioidaceae bacterium]|nr:FAD:protein FMN transferase [Nocardioidaceae bacterium]
MNAPTRHTRFDALGTYVFLAVRRPVALRGAERVARRVLADVDATCSRFRADSDLSMANRHAGSWVDVDPLLVAALEVACDAARRTGGLVNPLLGRQLVQLGYDRDFDQLRDCAEQVTIPWPEPGPDTDAWREIAIDPAGAVRVPADTALDLGSVGKAWAADLVAVGIEQELGEPAVVSLGG